eukprot:scaffold109103_cov38-Prasinocladus_malaysianus.AAC.2
MCLLRAAARKPLFDERPRAACKSGEVYIQSLALQFAKLLSRDLVSSVPRALRGSICLMPCPYEYELSWIRRWNQSRIQFFGEQKENLLNDFGRYHQIRLLVLALVASRYSLLVLATREYSWLAMLSNTVATTGR